MKHTGESVMVWGVIYSSRNRPASNHIILSFFFKNTRTRLMTSELVDPILYKTAPQIFFTYCNSGIRKVMNNLDICFLYHLTTNKLSLLVGRGEYKFKNITIGILNRISPYWVLALLRMEEIPWKVVLVQKPCYFPYQLQCHGPRAVKKKAYLLCLWLFLKGKSLCKWTIRPGRQRLCNITEGWKK